MRITKVLPIVAKVRPGVKSTSRYLSRGRKEFHINHGRITEGKPTSEGTSAGLP